MDIKKIIAFSEKLGVKPYDKHNLQVASWQVVQYGADYFYNVKKSYNAVMFCFDYSSFYYLELEKIAGKIKKYAERYNFSIVSSWHHLGGFGFSVMPSSQWDELETIHIFEEYARQNADELIHKYHVEGKYNTNHAQLEAELYNILIEGENAYFERINADNIAV